MNIQVIHQKLREIIEKLEAAHINDEAKLDLEILVLQLKKQLIVGGFDPLKELSTITIADLSNLEKLTSQIEQEIQDESKRVKLVKQLISTAKIAIKAAGLPIPS